MPKHIKLGKITAILSIIFNAAILFGVVYGVVLGIMKRTSISSLEPWYQLFFYFTVDSNILLGVSSLMMIIYSFISLKTNRIPRWVTNFKYVSTVATTLTFMTVIIVFSVIMKVPYIELIQDNNLYHHLICPVLAIISLVFIELHNKIKFRMVPVALLPSVIYGVIYGIGYYAKWPWFIKDEYAFISSFEGNGVYFMPYIIFAIVFVLAIILWALCQLTSIEDVKKEDEVEAEEHEIIDEIEDIDRLINKDKKKEEKENKKASRDITSSSSPKKKPITPESEEKAVVVDALKEKKVTPEKEEKEASASTPKKKASASKNDKKETSPVKAAPKKKESAPKKETKSSSTDSKKKQDAPKVEEESTNKVRTYHISKNKSGDKWQVKLANGQKAIKLFDTQAEAIEYAKSLVETQGGSLRVHSRKGSIRKV